MARIEAEPAWTVAALNYELGYLLEPAAAPAGWEPGRSLARFWRFRERLEMSAAQAEAWLAVQNLGSAGVGNVRPGIEQAEYEAQVERIRQWITDGDCYQVNFTLPLHFSWFGTPLALYARLRERQPVRFGGAVADADGGIVSLSPELFVERDGPRLHTRPMKGTRPLDVPASELLDSEKDRAENLMIVDLLRNDLGRLAEPGSVTVEELFAIEDYPTVRQMVSSISAKVEGKSLEAMFRALFPCGSITGAPKIRAMQIAAELENGPRGLYTGSLGWLAPNGDFRLNVAIRTLELAADRSGRLGIGSGIVADSKPDDEWRECLLKARFLTECDPGLRLIETLRCETGVYPRLAGHLERLQRSAEWLGFPFDAHAVRQALANVPNEGVCRVRLTLNKLGQFDVQAFPLAPEPEGPRQAVLAESVIDSTNPLRRHKTTDRALYDAELASLANDPSVFDAIFLNERGELAEGARSNIFVYCDGVLLTPPLASGALPGVLRAELLAAGRAREETLWPADLVNGFWLGNALRGLIWVTLRPLLPQLAQVQAE